MSDAPKPGSNKPIVSSQSTSQNKPPDKTAWQQNISSMSGGYNFSRHLIGRPLATREIYTHRTHRRRKILVALILVAVLVVLLIVIF